MTVEILDPILGILVHESGQAREDDRIMHTILASLIAVAISLVIAMAALFANTCPKGHCPLGTDLTAVPIWVYIIAPMLPISLISYTILISSVGTVRSYYMRVIEHKICQLTKQNHDTLPVPSWAHIQLEVTSQTHSGWLARLNWNLVYGIVLIMLLGNVYLTVLKIPIEFLRYRIFAIVFDGLLLLIPTITGILIIRRGTQLWNKTLASLPDQLNRTAKNFETNGNGSERTLFSFLLLPRNREDLVKTLFIPASFLIGILLSRGITQLNSDRFWNFVCFFLIFEFLIYQARYLLNDIRDREIDCSENLWKRRFPKSLVNDTVALNAALLSFLTRLLVAALLVVYVLPTQNSIWLWHVSFLTSIFLIAVPYESVRSKCNQAAKNDSRSSTLIWSLVLILLVGLGYGLRSVVGLWLAGVNDKLSLILLAVGASLFGIAFVSLTWALESTRAKCEELQVGKAHLVMFRHAVERATKSLNASLSSADKVLSHRQPLLAPWSVCAILSTSVLVTFVLYLLRERLEITQSCAIAIAVIVITAVGSVMPVKKTRVLTGSSFLVLCIVLHLLSVPVIQNSIAVVIATLPIITTCYFRNSSYNDLLAFTDEIIKQIKDIFSPLYFWFTQKRKRSNEAEKAPSPAARVREG